jgi:hypothetical protein
MALPSPPAGYLDFIPMPSLLLLCNELHRARILAATEHCPAVVRAELAECYDDAVTAVLHARDGHTGPGAPSATGAGVRPGG